MACDSPFWVLPKGHPEKVPVPCGRCPPCKKRRVDGWVFRLLQEQNVHSDSHFVTLTYDTAHVPISQNGWLTLIKRDVQLYFKRLRKMLPNATIKYYAAGEYGSDNLRPHYHAIIFGVSDQEFFYKAWQVDGVPIGSVHVGQVSGDSIGYTMKYIDKSNTKPVVKGWTAFVGRDDRVREFALMSKGLGKNYVTDAVKRFHWADYSRLYITRPDGVKIAMPRYFKDRIYNADDGGMQLSLIREAVAKQEAEQYKRFQSLTKNWPDSYDYGRYLDDARMQRYKRFYSQLKPRSL